MLHETGRTDARPTLALVGCDPAAGLLTAEYGAALDALIRLLRSRAHWRLVEELPGYSARHKGEVVVV